MHEEIHDPVAVAFEEEEPTGWLFLRALGAAFKRPVPWIATWFLLLVMSAALALPWQAWFEKAVDHRYAKDELIRSLSTSFRYDHSSAIAQLDGQTAQLGAVLALLAVLTGVFAAGGWLFVFLERGEGRSLRRFLQGGVAHFWRFFRLWFLFMILLGAWHWVFYGLPWNKLVLEQWLQVPKYDQSRLESLDSEWRVAALGWVRDGLFAIGFAFTLTWGVFARTRMAYFRRPSAFKALFGSLGTILRHPLRSLRPMLALLLVEALLISVGVGWLVRAMGGRFGERDSWMVVAALFLVGQFAVMWREMSRGAKYFAALTVTRGLDQAVVSTWPSLGGPGGPQYPLEEQRGHSVDDTEEGYGAAL